MTPNVTERQGSNGPAVEDLPDPVFRNIEPRGDIRRAPAPNKEKEHHAPRYVGRWVLEQAGIREGKETMFRRTARRRTAQPGWTGVFGPRLIVRYPAPFGLSPICHIQESRPAGMKIA